MKQFSLAAVFALAASAAFAAGTEEPTPIPLDPGTVEFNGTWNYSTSNHQVSGDCPNGRPMNGTLFISQTGADVGLMVTSGATCNPASMCMYSGAIDDEFLLASNTATVDEEGGSATNALRLHFYSAASGGGQSSSSYVHPKGFECQWTHNILLWRSED